ncbi:B12-binding domain-containing radical SAM protein [Planctomycetota bacterium]
MERKLDCHLLFPPPWTLLAPVHIALPLLAGHLLSRGFGVAQSDLNLAVARLLLSVTGAEQAASDIRRQLADPTHDLGEETRERKRTALAAAPFVVDQIAEACEALRSAAEQPRELASPIQIVRLAGELVAASSTGPMRWNPFAGEYRSAELDHAFTLQSAFSSLVRAELDPVETALRAALAEALAGRPAHLYGLGIACSEQLYPALRCGSWIRELDPGARVLLGGAAASSLASTIVSERALYDYVDFLVVGDGELPLEMVLRAMRGETHLAEVPNLYYLDMGGVRRSRRVWHAGSEAPAPPCFDGVDLAAYFARPTLPVLAGRRCYWNRCAFCSNTREKTARFGPTKARRVVETMRLLAKATGCRVFTFVDDAVPPAQLGRIADALIEGGDDFTWDAQVRFEKSFDRSTFERAYRAGMRAVYFGLESGSQRVVDLMDKGFEVGGAERTLRDASAAGLWTTCYALLGFPGEEAEDVLETVGFCRRNKDHLDLVSVSVFELHRHSPVGCDPEAFGVTTEPPLPLSLEHRLPQPSRERVLEERRDRFRRSVRDRSQLLHAHALNSSNLLHVLRRSPKRSLLALLERAETQGLQRLLDSRHLRAAGGSAVLGLSNSCTVGDACGDAVPVFCAATGALVLLPVELLELCRRGASVADLGRLLSDRDEDMALVFTLFDFGVLSRRPAGA